MDRSLTEPIWQFLKEEMGVRDFEAWFYANEVALRPYLGEQLHEDLLFLNFGNIGAVLALLPKLERAVRAHVRCECEMLRAKDQFFMGFDGRDRRFRATVKPIKKYGEPLWWLYLGQCSVCAQHWMVAEDGNTTNIVVNRLSPDEADRILKDNDWPDDFLTYERLLKRALR